jgi:tripartite-type tricarboxylate transporter receptor subunit TctC
MNRRRLLTSFLLPALMAWSSNGLAQAARPAGNAAAYPNALIRFVVPFAPGSGNDILARRMGQLLSDSFKQTVIIENQAGAGGIIGIAQVARAAPNGYVIGMGSTSTLAIGPYMQKEPPYDPVKDLAPITLLASAPYIIALHPRVPASTLTELVTYAKANRGKLNYSSAGIGTTPHLAAEVFNKLAGVDFVHVPYKGAAPATAGAVAGEVQILYGPIVSTAPMLKSGQLKAVAMTGAQRSAVVPGIPTIAESGYPGYEASNWYGIVAPARTPVAITERLNREIVRHLSTPEVRAQITKDGAQVLGNSVNEFAEFIKNESERYKKIISELNLAAP